MRQTHDQKCSTVSEVAADWLESKALITKLPIYPFDAHQHYDVHV